MSYIDDLKAILNNEIKVAESKLQPHDTGHISTAISYMKSRLVEIENTEKELRGDNLDG